MYGDVEAGRGDLFRLPDFGVFRPMSDRVFVQRVGTNVLLVWPCHRATNHSGLEEISDILELPKDAKFQ